MDSFAFVFELQAATPAQDMNSGKGISSEAPYQKVWKVRKIKVTLFFYAMGKRSLEDDCCIIKMEKYLYFHALYNI